MEPSRVHPTARVVKHRAMTPAVTLRPFEGEVLTGTVLSCDRFGARLSIGFFDDIHVPSAMLQVRISAVSRPISERIPRCARLP